MRKQNLILKILWVLISFFSYFFANGQHSIAVLAWIYPILFLGLFHLFKESKALQFIFIIYTYGFYMQWSKVIGMSLNVCLVIGIGLAILKLIPYLLYQHIHRDKQSFYPTLLFAAAMVTVEYIIYLLNPILGGLSDAYTQYENLQLINIASLFGIYGVSFIMFWTAAVVERIFFNRNNIESIRKEIIIFVIVIGSVMLYGSVRINLPDDVSETIRIASVTVPVKEILEEDEDVSKVFYTDSFSDENLQATKDKLDKVHQELFDKSILEAKAGAKIVLWSELNGAVLKEDEDKLISRASQVAEEENIYLILSLLVKTPHEKYKENKTIAINPQGKIVSEYYKSGLSIGELCIKGDGIMKDFSTGTSKIVPFICSDMAFTRIINYAGRNQADIILVPASDWKEMSPVAIKTAIVRGIENGCSIVRQTNMGISIASDYYGRILARNNYYTSATMSMVSEIPLQGKFSLYPYIGNILPWGCIISLIGFIILRIRSIKSVKS